MSNDLYRYLDIDEFNPTYVVYRSLGEKGCDVKKEAIAHRQALFMYESDAIEYCKFKNQVQS